MWKEYLTVSWSDIWWEIALVDELGCVLDSV